MQRPCNQACNRLRNEGPGTQIVAGLHDIHGGMESHAPRAPKWASAAPSRATTHPQAAGAPNLPLPQPAQPCNQRRPRPWPFRWIVVRTVARPPARPINPCVRSCTVPQIDSATTQPSPPWPRPGTRFLTPDPLFGEGPTRGPPCSWISALSWEPSPTHHNHPDVNQGHASPLHHQRPGRPTT